MITLQGLTRRQVIIAECLWTKCQTQRDVKAVLEHYGQDAQTVYELLTAAAMDEYMEVTEAAELIDRIKNL